MISSESSSRGPRRRRLPSEQSLSPEGVARAQAWAAWYEALTPEEQAAWDRKLAADLRGSTSFSDELPVHLQPHREGET